MASTHFPKEGDITRKWHIVDASGQTLGRLASRVARILAGKESTQYTPFIDTGDHVIVINAAQIKLTGEDRKSTRLNSSHMSISYAVFCLKKKKTTVFSHSTIRTQPE